MKPLPRLFTPADAESLPTQKRELKLRQIPVAQPLVVSLPTRERELKRFRRVPKRGVMWSLPTRERELKLAILPLTKLKSAVTPYTGA